MINQKKRNSQMKVVEPAAGSSSILSKLFQQILYSKGIASPNISNKNSSAYVFSDKWTTLVEEYLSDSRNSIKQNIKDRSSARGNLQKEIIGNKGMSWKVFCKALRLLGVVKFDITITATFSNNKQQNVFSEHVNLGERIPYPSELPMSSNGSILVKDIFRGTANLPKNIEVQNDTKQ